MGKTLFITRMAERLQSVVVEGDVHITIPVHGPLVTTDSVMQYLVNHQSTSHCTILHFDISPSVRELPLSPVLCVPITSIGVVASGYYPFLTAYSKRLV